VRSRGGVRSVVGAIVAAAVLAGCQSSDQGDAPAASRVCDERGRQPAGYRTKGRALAGDVDGDGRVDRVTLRLDDTLPPRCRNVLVVELRGGDAIVLPVTPLSWPGTDPRLTLLAEIDGQAGLEPVVELSPVAVYRPAAVFTMRAGELLRMRRDVDPKLPDDLFPVHDEFPSGVDCAAKPGTIVVTVGNLGEHDDSHWDITRSRYRAVGTRFKLVGEKRSRLEVGPEAKHRWPELRGEPFLSCSGRVK
jgi:hypothetical protein